MSVFLRWGVFGILGVAALLYAYNASKRLAEVHAAHPAAAPAAAAPSESETSASLPGREAGPQPAAIPAAPTRCEEELLVARRAIDMRKQGEPLDRHGAFLARPPEARGHVHDDPVELADVDRCQ